MGGVWKKVPSPFSRMWSGTGIVLRSMLILGKLEWCQRRRMCGDGAGWFRYHTEVVRGSELLRWRLRIVVGATFI